jgi:hypothetical protein
MTGSKMLFAQKVDGSRRKVEVWYTLSIELVATDQDGYPLEDSFWFAELESALDAMRLLQEDEYRYACIDRYVRVWDAPPGMDYDLPTVQHQAELKTITQNHADMDHFDILAIQRPPARAADLDPCRGDCRKDGSGRCPFDPVCNN